MTKKMNEIRDIKAKVENWMPPARPDFERIVGNYAKIESLSAKTHAMALFQANLVDDSIWDYLPYGPFEAESDYRHWVNSVENGQDPVFMAIYDNEQEKWSGVASYLRISPDMGSIEVGHINYSKPLQKTRAATETMYLMMKWAFEAGYRRYEWKCDAANFPSCRAAERYGFSYEGIFRQAAIVKGRNRDTAWFAIIDSEWPAIKQAFQTWLCPDNFDPAGRQIQNLRELTSPVVKARDSRQT